MLPLYHGCLLLVNNTYACETVCTHRKGLPTAVTKSNIKKQTQGDFVLQQKGNMAVVSWHDKRTVLVLATNADLTEIIEVQQKQNRHLSNCIMSYQL